MGAPSRSFLPIRSNSPVSGERISLPPLPFAVGSHRTEAMSFRFLLLEDSRLPQDAIRRRALGLPPASSFPSDPTLLRIEGLPPVSLGALMRIVRSEGGHADRLAPTGGESCTLLRWAPASGKAILAALRREPGLEILATELTWARRASRGETRALRLPRRRIPLAGRTLIQGILNVTPDSFHDRGRWKDTGRAVARGLEMAEEGADLIDVGGESTRPGAHPVSAREEIRRVLPVIEALTERTSIPLSVDTTKAEVAEAALAAGAEMVNDISGLSFDARIAEVCSRHRAALVVCHIRGKPRSMQRHPRYRHLLPEVTGFLQESVRRALEAGLSRDSILVDPGIGFGKTASHNLLLLRHLSVLHSAGCPILVGASRKSFLGRILGDHSPDRLLGSLAVAALAVHGGAAVLRVHDVSATREAARVARAVRDATLPSPAPCGKAVAGAVSRRRGRLRKSVK